MNKYIIFIILLSVAVFFSGCNSNEREIYESIIADSVNDEHSVSPEVEYWNGMYFDKGDMTDQSCVVLDNLYHGAYAKSIIDNQDSYTTDIYRTEDGVEFGLRSDTGELAYINLMNNEFFDTQPFLPDISDPLDSAIAFSTEIADEYVDNISDYTMIVEEPRISYKEKDGKNYEITYYVITFAKKINGYFSSDYISVKVTSKGALASIKMGDINAFEDVEVDFETSKIDQSISNKVRSVYEKDGLKIKQTYLRDQKIVLTPNGEIAMDSFVGVDIIDSDGEYSTGVSILTVLKKKNK